MRIFRDSVCLCGRICSVQMYYIISILSCLLSCVLCTVTNDDVLIVLCGHQTNCAVQMRSEARCEAREARPGEVRDCSSETRE